MQSLQRGLLAIAASLSLCACAVDATDVPSADLAGDREPEGVWVNSLGAGALTRNALIANRTANAVMPNVPLSTASYADATAPIELRNQLRHAPTREMMGYLVSCALGPTQAVSYSNLASGIAVTWQGELGLCPQWNTAPASPLCQELVSACLLARVNAYGVKVDLSMRGQAPGTGSAWNPSLLPAPTVATSTESRSGAALHSFDGCLTPTTGPARDCGYVANQVGTCTPGAYFNVGAGAPPPLRCTDPAIGTSTGNTLLRVCEGTHGCDHASTNLLGESSGGCGLLKPSIRLLCPASGTFSVMSGPETSDGAAVASPEARSPSPVAYPADEEAVFPWQEGAFYGNLWGSASVNKVINAGENTVDAAGVFHPAAPIPLSAGPVFLRMFACSGVYWNNESAYLKQRVCAGSSTDCAARPVGACSTSMTTPCPATNACSVTDGSVVVGDGDYHLCGGGGSTWANPITVYLNDPLDIVPLQPGFTTSTTGSPSAPAAPLCP